MEISQRIGALARPLGRAQLRFGPKPSLTVGLVPRRSVAAEL